MYPCGQCRATAVGPDGRCAACGAYQQPAQQQPAAPAYPYPAAGAPTAAPMAAPTGMPMAPPMGMPVPMPVGGVDLRRGVRIAVIVLLGASVLVSLLSLAAIGQQRSAIQAMLDEGISQATMDKADAADDFDLAMTVVGALIGIVTAVLWVIWFRRTRLNAEVFAPGTHRFGSGWAVGSWFTPVVSLWFPKQMANDIYRASAPAGPQSAPKGLLNAWWTLWIASTVVSFVGMGMEATTKADAKQKFRSGTLDRTGWEDAADGLKNALTISGLAMLLGAAAGVLAILVVRQLTQMQEQRAVAGPPAAAPPMGGGTPYGGMPYGAAPYGGMPYGAAPGVPGAPGMPGGAPAQGWSAPYGPPGAQPPQNPFGSGPAGS
ncbi:DUF4328 domain-containing protein [Streptomyces sp. NPDC053048]|uniref:DUF4328 domain-containing protein n=1 Tax=Streptomyces sp. NPDC053048 TaxID=3365694 RepID=UPI0037D93051